MSFQLSLYAIRLPLRRAKPESDPVVTSLAIPKMLPFASIEHAYELDYAPSGAGNNECKSNIESAVPDQSKECVNSPVRWPHPTCFPPPASHHEKASTGRAT